jgi:hypothetical protein
LQKSTTATPSLQKSTTATPSSSSDYLSPTSLNPSRIATREDKESKDGGEPAKDEKTFLDDIINVVKDHYYCYLDKWYRCTAELADLKVLMLPLLIQFKTEDRPKKATKLLKNEYVKMGCHKKPVRAETPFITQFLERYRETQNKIDRVLQTSLKAEFNCTSYDVIKAVFRSMGKYNTFKEDWKLNGRKGVYCGWKLKDGH